METHKADMQLKANVFSFHLIPKMYMSGHKYPVKLGLKMQLVKNPKL